MNHSQPEHISLTDEKIKLTPCDDFVINNDPNSRRHYEYVLKQYESKVFLCPDKVHLLEIFGDKHDAISKEISIRIEPCKGEGCSDGDLDDFLIDKQVALILNTKKITFSEEQEMEVIPQSELYWLSLGRKKQPIRADVFV